MTLNNFRTLSRLYVRGAKIGTIKNPELDLILNKGADDIAQYTACLKTNKKFTVTAEQNEYNLSSVIGDFLVPDKPGLWWNAGTASSPDWLKLDPKTLAAIDKDRPDWRDEESDDPLEYSIESDILTLVPIPNTTLVDGLWLYYGKAPTYMTSGTYYPFTGTTTEYTHLRVFDDAILAYAKWKMQEALNKDGRDDFKLLETAYKRVREEAYSLFKRRPDISFSKYTKLQGRKFRS